MIAGYQSSRRCIRHPETGVSCEVYSSAISPQQSLPCRYNIASSPDLHKNPLPSAMFNRNNLPSVSNPFGSRQDGGARPPPRDPYNSSGQGPAPSRRTDQGYQPQGRGDYDTQMNDGHGMGRASAAPPQHEIHGSQRGVPSRSSGMKGNQGMGGRTWQLRPAKSPDNTYTFRNL